MVYYRTEFDVKPSLPSLQHHLSQDERCSNMEDETQLMIYHHEHYKLINRNNPNDGRLAVNE